jgi:hypothetical protein
MTHGELTSLQRRLSQLRGKSGFNEADVRQLSILVREAKDILGFRSYAAMAGSLNVSARIVRERVGNVGLPSLVSYMRVVNGLLKLVDRELTQNSDFESLFEGRPAQWMLVPDNLRGHATQVANSLDVIITKIRAANNTEQLDGDLSPITRAQLIAALETAIAILKTPVTEVGYLRRLGGVLVKMKKNAVHGAMNFAIFGAAEEGGRHLMEFLSHLMK